MFRRVIPAVALFGCTDVNFRAQENTPPTPTILSHRDGDTALEGYPFLVRGSVVDNGGVEGVQLTWYANDVEVCSALADPELGTSECEMVTEVLGALRVRLEAKDTSDAIASAFVDLLVEPSEPPVATITRPTPTGVFYSNTPVVLEGVLDDAEDPPDLLTAAWTEGATAIVGGTTPDAGGTVSTTTLLAQGSHTLTLTVTDGSGKTGSDEVTILVGGPNDPPTCDLVSPAEGAFSGQWNEITVAGVVSDPNIAATALIVRVESDVDGLLSEVVPSVNGDVALPWASLSLGTHILTLSATDEAGASCQDSVVHTVVEPPTAPVVLVEPDPPESADDLVCSIVVPSTDPSPSGPLTYVFEWTYDGVAHLGATSTTTWPGDTVPAAETAPGQVWECAARATDGDTTGAPGVDDVTVSLPTAVQIRAGMNHSCLLDSNNWFECWGSSANNLLDLTDGTFIDVAIAPYSTCGIEPDGDLICVGLDTLGRIDTSALIGPFVQVDVGDDHGCAIDDDQMVQCWGDATDGKTDTSALLGDTWRAVSANYSTSCAISTSDELVCWGADTFGKISEIPPGISWATIATGRFHNCGLDVAGLAHCFGKDYASNAPTGTFAQVDAGDEVSCGVRGTGEIECWGVDTAPGEINEPPVGLFTQVAVGNGHQCAIDLLGAVVCWGNNTNGELNAPAIWW